MSVWFRGDAEFDAGEAVREEREGRAADEREEAGAGDPVVAVGEVKARALEDVGAEAVLGIAC